MDALKAYLARWAKWMLAGAVCIGVWGVVVMFFMWLVSVIQPWFVIAVVGFLMITAGLALCGFRIDDYRKEDTGVNCSYCGVKYTPTDNITSAGREYLPNCLCVEESYFKKKDEDAPNSTPHCNYCETDYVPSSMLHGGKVVYIADCTCAVDGCKFTTE